MKKVFLFLLLINLFTLAAQEEIRTLNYPSGEKQYEGKIVNGKQEGTHLWWHQNGKLMLEANYANGEPNGVWTRYNEKGDFVSQETFVNGLREGKYVFLQEVFDTEEEAKFDSLGNLVSETSYRKYVHNYKNNQMVGPFQSFYANGSLCEEGQYENGKATGFWKKYDRKKYLIEIVEWKEGRPFSKRTFTYYNNGKKRSETFFILYPEEVAHGTWYEWHENGKLKSQNNYLNGKINGEWKSWHENGKRSFKATYKDNQLVKGSWVEYNQKGRKIKTKN
ncbi:MAG: toxin-antitoxin system YwqK family antitoxin [Flavobacteriales bacterium]|nr:toxin-antitoxin system YwqK family antitoxin [Flavobacteriales bacterium]